MIEEYRVGWSPLAQSNGAFHGPLRLKRVLFPARAAKKAEAEETMEEQTGYIPVVNDQRVWYRSVGGGAAREEVPLLVLHGGPGCPHDYLENLAALASEKRRVIFYDQLG